MAVIAFIGLGQMGSPMASNLLKQGHQLSVFDVNPDAVQRLVDKGAQPASSPAQATIGAEFVITMLPNGDLVRSVLFGEQGVCETLSREALVIDMSTIHPLQTDKLIADMQSKGFSMMDVPVGRTSDNAITGTLLLLAGGTAEQVERATPVLMAMGNELVNTGGPGMGIRVKLINNYMSIALNALSAEAAVLCEALGLSFDVALKVMSGTAAGKGHFTTTWPNKVMKGDLSPAFMIDLAHKDLGIALDVANQLHVPMPLGAASREVYNLAARRPALILMDELAHSNAPGSRHPKRWQDIEELLEAGIDVFTTVNVQHLESLNDVVSGVTGIQVRETVPDPFFDAADEVVLVDLPPDDLRQRLNEGKVYIAGQAERAIEHFFRKGNLIALRELALRRTADRVDDQMRA
ncbi:Osmosensitive K+ channel histidine kinase KdpD [Salmonella enterica subsp. enterica serovar Adelaide str. A4-669]|uniref:3-sulfolactaldehyde reductase n=6 Tax=Enterobacteriaceae TaxID=543 RepID=A0A6C8GFT4_SALET|nr:Osmosensitive K+ channel histidine kinase KdpD [Salmonella enterica subsp. enterica serovar Adelaide str. A4-669]